MHINDPLSRCARLLYPAIRDDLDQGMDVQNVTLRFVHVPQLPQSVKEQDDERPEVVRVVDLFDGILCADDVGEGYK